MQCGISLSLSLTATTAPFSFWMTSAWQLWAELPHPVFVGCIEATCRPSIFGSWNRNGFDWQVEFVNAGKVKSPTVRHCIGLIIALSLQRVNQLAIVVHTLWGRGATIELQSGRGKKGPFIFHIDNVKGITVGVLLWHRWTRNFPGWIITSCPKYLDLWLKVWFWDSV